jgi:hypothetical protein
LAGYRLEATDASALPTRLSLTQSPAGRVLAHVAPNGGTFFSHVLLDVPSTTDTHTAIQTWGSPQWQRHAPDRTADLPDVPFLPVADRLDEASLKAWLTLPDHRELLEYAIGAMLNAPPSASITLNASGDDMAMIVFAVTRAFPSNLTDDLTFSTFEPDPLACSARLIGCDRTLTGTDLPDGCYANGRHAFNPALDRRTPLAKPSGFAAFAVDALASGDLTALDEFRATWQRLGLQDFLQFDLIVRLFRGTVHFDRTEMSAALQSPAIALWVSARPDAVAPLTEWALDDQAFATGPFARVVQAMRPRTDLVAKLTDTVRGAGLDAVHAGEGNRVANAFDVILPMVAPAKAQAIWGEIEKLDPATLTWPMLWQLLPKVVQSRQRLSPTAGPSDLPTWLEIPADKLAEFLALDLPQAYRVAAARREWPAEEGPTVAAALAGHPEVAWAALVPPWETDHDRAATLFESLVVHAPSRSWFDDTLSRADDYPAPLLNRFFETELDHGRTDADRLIRTHGETLLNRFAGHSGLAALVDRFLAAPPADLLHQPGLVAFLGTHRQTANPEQAAAIAAVETVFDFQTSPKFDTSTLTLLAAALDRTPSPLPATAKSDTTRTIADALSKRFDSPAFQEEFETVAVALGATLAKGPTDLVQDLLRDLRSRTGFSNSLNATSAALAMSLGAVQSPDAKFAGLEPDAFAVASDAVRIGKVKRLDELDGRTAGWPDEAKAKWGFLREAVRPPANRFGRDFACFVAGAAATGIAGAAWWFTR